MRVLLDECIDWRLSRDISGHDVKTAQQMGWTAIKNGELLTLASTHFDVFVTGGSARPCDRAPIRWRCQIDLFSNSFRLRPLE